MIFRQKSSPSSNDEKCRRNQVRLKKDLSTFLDQGWVTAFAVVALEGQAEQQNLENKYLVSQSFSFSVIIKF